MHRTVAELEDTMTSAEYVEWLAYDALNAADREHAQREARMYERMRRNEG